MTDLNNKLLRLGILLSGEGTSFENVARLVDSGQIPAEVALVISSKVEAKGLERAERRKIPQVAVPRKAYPDITKFNDEIHSLLELHSVDFVALLGFLSPFQPRSRFSGKTINVHPALIPAFSGKGFYGRRVHEAVLQRGCKVSGATVHFVDDHYDQGPIILQETVPVLETDSPSSRASRVQAVETQLVPEAIRLYAAGRLQLIDGVVRILP